MSDAPRYHCFREPYSGRTVKCDVSSLEPTTARDDDDDPSAFERLHAAAVAAERGSAAPAPTPGTVQTLVVDFDELLSPAAAAASGYSAHQDVSTDVFVQRENTALRIDGLRRTVNASRDTPLVLVYAFGDASRRRVVDSLTSRGCPHACTPRMDTADALIRHLTLMARSQKRNVK